MASTVLCSFASFHLPTHMAEQSVHIYSMHCTSFDGSMRSGQFCMVECQPCGSSNNIYFIIESNNRMDRQFSKCKNVIKRIHTICFGSYCMHIYTMHVEHWSSHLHTHTLAHVQWDGDIGGVRHRGNTTIFADVYFLFEFYTTAFAPNHYIYTIPSLHLFHTPLRLSMAGRRPFPS